jgi:hypothetical protein
MFAIKEGHKYTLATLDGNEVAHLQFVDRGFGTETAGTTNQEVLRVLIDRVKYLDKELHWEGNEQILKHLRLALVLHEARHLERLVVKGLMKPETIATGEDGHFILADEIQGA